MTDTREGFRQFIEQICGTDPGVIIADGRWHRFNIKDTRKRTSKPGRYLLHDDDRPVGWFMDWRDEKNRHRWFGKSTGETIDRAEIERRRLARQMDQMRKFQDAADEALSFWRTCKPINEVHPYLEAKGVKAYGTRQGSGARFGLGDAPCVIVPIADAEGKPLSLQAIRADGERRFWPGSTHEGGHFLIGTDDGAGPLIFCEGYSTGATLHEATGCPVVVALNTSNMAHVARWASHRWAGREMIVAGDDDWHLVDHPKVQRNVGKETAQAMAKALPAKLVMPEMYGLVTEGGDDFNDMAREYGLDAVSDYLGQAKEQAVEGEDEPNALGFTITEWSTDRYAGEAPPIQWLCEGSIPLAVPALFAAMGGVGKSFMALDMALEIASEVINGNGTRRILGGPIREHGSVVVLGAEDAKDSVHRRMAAIDPGGRREAAHGKLFVVPLPEVGGPMTLIAGQSGEYLQTAKLEALIEQLLKIPDLKLVVLDPLQAFITANITSDPAAGQFMWSAFARICAVTGATVIACHHMRKEGSSTIETTDQAREAIRGSTALIDGARATYALWAASEDVTRRVCQEVGVEHRPKRVVNGAVVKANDEHDWEIHTYVRAENGLLTDANEAGKRAAQKSTRMTESQCMDFLKTIESRWRSGRPFSAAANSQDRYAIAYMQRQYGVSKYVAKSQLDDWFHAEMVRSEIVDKKTKLQGLMVAKWPE